MRPRGAARLTAATGPAVLFVTAEPIGVRMAGPAIRTLELARAVAADPRTGPVTVASLAAVDLPAETAVRVLAAPDPGQLAGLAAQAGAVVVQGDVLGLHPHLVEGDRPVVVDVYDPFHLEQLERTRGEPDLVRRAVVRDCTASLDLQLARADLVLCASRRQRALWLGHLAALGRVNPVNHDRAPDLGHLVAVVPFGVPDRPPAPRDRGVLADVFPGLADDDVVAVWGGGIYEWLDPLTLVRAVAAAQDRAPGLRLLFLGTRHPVAGVDSTASAARAVAQELGVLGSTVVFRDGWVPYQDRDRFLGACDIAVSTHWEHLETEFAFRTRVLDALWCGLPVVSTGGDELAELVDRTGSGTVVPPGDQAALEAALVELATDPARRRAAGAAAAELATRFVWHEVVRPLADFCAAPRRAPDLQLDAVARLQLGLRDPTRRPGSRVQRVRATWREGGSALLRRRLAGRLARRRP